MPIIPSTTPSNFNNPITDQGPTAFETITGAPFNILNAPSNAVKSLIRAAQNQSWEDAGNAITSLIPFAGSETVPASDITGSDSFLINLATDIVTDPLMLVGGIGSLTKTGKAAALVTERAVAVKIASKLGTAEQLMEAKSALTSAETALQAAKLAKPGEVARSMVRFAGKDIGNFDTVKKLAGIVNPMPDVRMAAYQNELLKVGQQLKKAEPLSNREAELFGKANKLKEELQSMNKGFIPIPLAQKIRDKVRVATALFKHSGNDELIETAKDYTMSNIARDNRLLGTDAAHIVNEIETLAREKGISVIEQQQRLLKGAEFRSTLEGAAPDIEKVVLEKSTKAYEKYQSRLAKVVGDTEGEAKVWQKFVADVNSAKNAGEDARLAQVGFLQELTDNPYTAGEINTMDKIRAMYEGLPKLESDNFLISSDLKSSRGMLEYSRRLVTDEAKALRKKNPNLFSLIHSEYGVNLGAAKQRKLYPERDILAINEQVKQDYGIKFDFFDTNVVKAMMERRSTSIAAVNRSKYIQFAIGEMGKEGLTKSEGYTPGFFAQMLNGSKGPGKAGQFDVFAIQKAYKGRRIPKDMAHEILGVDQILRNSIFNNNAGVGKIMQAVEAINAPFRALLTAPFPGFHHRNEVGNIINSWIGGINPARQVKYEIQARKLLKAIYTGEATAEQLKLMDKIIESRIIKGGLSEETTQLFARHGLKEESKLAQFMNKPLSTIVDRLGGKSLTAGRQFDVGTGRAYGKWIEDGARIGHWLAKRASGATDLEAMRSVNKYLFDYSKLTNFEKKFARPTVLFYSWLRNNLPLQLKTMITNPRVLESYNILTGQGGDEVPQYLRGSSSFKAPWSENTVVGSLGFPQEDLNLGNVAAADPGRFQQASAFADNLITRLSPAFRIPIEIAMGRTTFGRKPLQDLTPAQMLREFTPISRIVTTGKKVTDPETDSATKMIDLLTGVRTYSYNPDRVRIDKMKRALLQSGKAYRSGFLVLAKEENKDEPEVKRAVHELSRAIRNLAKEKKKNE